MLFLPEHNNQMGFNSYNAHAPVIPVGRMNSIKSYNLQDWLCALGKCQVAGQTREANKLA